jgi:hypothetical protein
VAGIESLVVLDSSGMVVIGAMVAGSALLVEWLASIRLWFWATAGWLSSAPWWWAARCWLSGWH